MLRCLVLVVSLACLGCPQPVPTPVPGPSPDIFYGQILDCHSGVVSDQRVGASPLITACLASATPTSCLISLVANPYDIATVACGVRDLDQSSTAAVNKKTATIEQATIKSNADAFITAEQLGFK
jgi:cystathionine beta-lyase family protein involved in aluminum resistance